MAAPSPRTKPSRVTSYGREAVSGLSLRVDSARMEPKPASISGWIAASVPPATTTSARPERIMSMAKAIASAPEAQAETGAWAPARAPSSMARAPAAPS